MNSLTTLSGHLRRALAMLALALLAATVSIAAPTAAQAAPQIQTWTSSQGARVFFLPATEIPMLDVRIVFDAGSARDGELAGLGVLSNGLLVEGAAGMDSQQIAEAFESVGAQVDYSSARDMAVLGVRSLTEPRYLEPALKTLNQVLTEPDFPEDAFARELKRMQIAVKARQQSPSAIAAEAFYKALYKDHPYATPVSGDADSLARISRQAVLDFYRRYYVAANAIVVLVGNVERGQAEQIVEQLFTGLPRGERAPPVPPVPELAQAENIVIDYPSAQTHILVGQTGIKRGDADYFPLYVANHIFGGSGFSSRLMEVIREDRGLAYSVYSYFSPMREAGPFIMGMQTKTEQTQQALALLDAELRKYVSEGPEPEELEASLSNITGGFALNIDSNGKLLDYIAMIGFYDLPIDYLDSFTANAEAVTVAAIRDALKRRLHPERMVKVVVGRQGGDQSGD